ncbi:hypothetical protein Tco_0072484 [Tanacetum coccineum]
MLGKGYGLIPTGRNAKIMKCKYQHKVGNTTRVWIMGEFPTGRKPSFLREKIKEIGSKTIKDGIINKGVINMRLMERKKDLSKFECYVGKSVGVSGCRFRNEKGGKKTKIDDASDEGLCFKLGVKLILTILANDDDDDDDDDDGGGGGGGLTEIRMDVEVRLDKL